tara:strand:+ start:190 stop:414 length:225 start_codon:yes stop_codon:yes gene_type:complete
MKKRNKLGLTPKQKKMYNTIVKFIEANKYSPSYEELKQILGYRSKCAIHGLVHQLKRRNWIRIEVGANRSIHVL